MGKGQQLQTGISYSRYSKSISAGFTEPYLFDKNILLGGEIFYHDYNASTSMIMAARPTYGQNRIGGVVRLGSRLRSSSPSAPAIRCPGRDYARREHVLRGPRQS